MRNETSMLTLYGIRQSRAGRALWVLEEAGLPYRLVPIDPKTGETRTADYLRLNPMAKVPVLVDGDFVLTESVAIAFYLGRKAGPLLWPQDMRSEARVYQWSSWAITEIEFHLTLIVREMRRATGGALDQDLIDTCRSAVADTMGALEAWLGADNAYITGDVFTVGDIICAFPIMGAAAQVDMTRLPAVQDWLARCQSRPAWQRVMAIDEAALR